MGGFLHGKQRIDYSSLSDDRLATLAQGGDEVAFNVLASRYLKMNPKITKTSFLETEDFAKIHDITLLPISFKCHYL